MDSICLELAKHAFQPANQATKTRHAAAALIGCHLESKPSASQLQSSALAKTQQDTPNP